MSLRGLLLGAVGGWKAEEGESSDGDLCSAHDWELGGWSLIYVVLLAYAAGGLALVRDRALFPAAREIVERTSPATHALADAGIALLAQVPHIVFASTTPTWWGSDVGQGLASGSAMFSVLLGVGVLPLAGGPFIGKWSRVGKEVIFLILAVVLSAAMTQAPEDGVLWVLEVAILLLLYAAYLILCASMKGVQDPADVSLATARASQQGGERLPLMSSMILRAQGTGSVRNFGESELYDTVYQASVADYSLEDRRPAFSLTWRGGPTRGPFTMVAWVLALPITVPTSLILPNLSIPQKRTPARVWWGYLAGLVWTAGLSVLAMICAHRLSCVFGYTPALVGAFCVILFNLPQVVWCARDSRAGAGAPAMYELLGSQVHVSLFAVAWARVARLGALPKGLKTLRVMSASALGFFLITILIVTLRMRRQVGCLLILVWVLLAIQTVLFEEWDIYVD